jgi:hypothetical protein
MDKNLVGEITSITTTMTPVLERAESFVVSNEDEAAEASVFLAKLKTSFDVVEKKRVLFTAPLNTSLKEINNFFRPILDSIKEKREILGNKILAWKNEENEKIAREEARRQAISDKAAERRGEDNTRVVEVERVEKTIGLATTRKSLNKFRIVDFSLIPDEFKTVDDVKLNAHIRNKENIDVRVPGIEIYQDDILSVKGL